MRIKDLKTYIVEAIKPPRLSAKNKHLWKDGIVDVDLLQPSDRDIRASYMSGYMLSEEAFRDGKDNASFVGNDDCDYWSLVYGLVNNGIYTMMGCSLYDDYWSCLPTTPEQSKERDEYIKFVNNFPHRKCFDIFIQMDDAGLYGFMKDDGDYIEENWFEYVKRTDDVDKIDISPVLVCFVILGMIDFQEKALPRSLNEAKSADAKNMIKKLIQLNKALKQEVEHYLKHNYIKYKI